MMMSNPDQKSLAIVETSSPSEQEGLKAQSPDFVGLLDSLRSGVVSPAVVEHLLVGRQAELAMLDQDLERLAQGQGIFRLITGREGSGKTTLLDLLRGRAHRKRVVTLTAHLSRDRLLSGKEDLELYRDLIAGMSLPDSADDLADIVPFFDKIIRRWREQSRFSSLSLEDIVERDLADIRHEPGGQAMAELISRHVLLQGSGRAPFKTHVLRWLEGGYESRSEVRGALGTANMIAPGDLYKSLKLIAKLVRIAGYSGLLVMIDEAGVLCRLQNSRVRSSNYNELRQWLDNALAGQVTGLGFVLAGTADLIDDERRGLLSERGLRSRLGSRGMEVTDRLKLRGPIIRLSSFEPEEVSQLLRKLRRLLASASGDTDWLPDEALDTFQSHCLDHMGAAYFQTPRDTIQAFVQFWEEAARDPKGEWRCCLKGEGKGDCGLPTFPTHETGDDELTSLRL